MTVADRIKMRRLELEWSQEELAKRAGYYGKPTISKYENAGNIRYDYPPDKRNTMHDDRVFAFGLLCFYLMQLRHGEIYAKRKNNP